jgi:hypothetical protein
MRLEKAPLPVRLLRIGASVLTLLLFCFVVLADEQTTEGKFTRVGADPIVVHLVDGVGTADIPFIRAPNTGLPLSSFTDASGGTDSISKDRMTLEWVRSPDSGKPPDKSDHRDLVIARIKINAQNLSFIQPDVAYRGKLIFLWDDNSKEPPPLDFTIQENSTAFTITTNANPLDIVLGPGQPGNISVRIKNTGQAKITNLSFSSFGLVDAATQHRAALPNTQVDIPSPTNPLLPGQELNVAVALPEPGLAGNYVGTLDVIANQKARQSISMSLRTRGPTYIFSYNNLRRLPFLLFLLVLGCGFWLSMKLEDWFGLGGLQRAQATISLNQSVERLKEKLKQVEQWQADHPNSLPRTRTWLQFRLDEARQTLDNASDMTQEQLTVKTDTFAANLTASNYLWEMIQTAKAQWPNDAQKLNAVVAQMDQVAMPQDASGLNKYREDVLKVLNDVIAADKAAGKIADDSQLLSSASSSPGMEIKDLRRKINWLAWLYRFAVWIVVFVLAYQTFYVSKFAFGTVLDYLTVILWSLGLTQTGTQILARGHSTYTRPS